MEERIRERIKQEIGTDVNVKKHIVVKNNGVQAEGYSVSVKGSAISPIIYVDEDITDEQKITQVVNRYVREHKKGFPEQALEWLGDEDKLYKKIIPTLIGKDSNLERLENDNIYHESFLDMEIVYKIMVGRDDIGGIGLATVKNDLIKHLNLDTSKMKERSMDNLEDIIEIEEMESILVSALGEEQFKAMYGEDALPVMYVVSNNEHFYGASALLSENVFKAIYEKVGTKSLFVIPSSVHEVIIVPNFYKANSKSEKETIATLKEMIESVNRTQVLPNEILTNSLYIHRRSKNEMEVA